MTNTTTNPPETTANKKTPKLRFKGFTGEWEKTTLGNLGRVAMNKRIYRNETTPKGEVPFYKIGTFGGKPDAYISRKLFEEYKSKYPYPNKGDLLISASGSIGRVVEYQGKDEYFQDSNIVWLEHNGAVDNSFLKQFYSLVKWAGLEGSTIKRLYNSNILNTEISLPEKAEQQKIGSFFQQLDTNLTQHQTQLEKLKNLKQAMLHKMFPQNGATEPEIRFKGFIGEWKFIQIDEICNLERGRVISKNEINNNFGKYPVYSSQTLNNGIFGYLNTFDFEGEHITWTTDGVNAGTVFYREGRFNCTNVCGVLNLKEQTYSANFIAIALNRVTYQHVSRTLANPKLMNGVMAKITFLIPSGKEQQKIGNYFRKLDQLITLQTTQLKKLQQIKQSCLTGMFV